MRAIGIAKIAFNGLLAVALIGLTHCSSSSGSEPAWQKKNDELIKEYNLAEKKLPGLPKTSIASNLEEAKTTSIDRLDNIELYSQVNAKFFWGTGTMISILQMAPNSKIPEETLPSDRFVFVLEGSIDQMINGAPVKMISKKREAPDGTHSGTPVIDFVYLEKGTRNSVTAGASGAKLLEVYSPLRLDYLQKAGVKNLPAQIEDVETIQTPNIVPNKVYDLFGTMFCVCIVSTSSICAGRC